MRTRIFCRDCCTNSAVYAFPRSLTCESQTYLIPNMSSVVFSSEFQTAEHTHMTHVSCIGRVICTVTPTVCKIAVLKMCIFHFEAGNKLPKLKEIGELKIC